MHPDDRDHAAKTAERAFRDGTSLEGDYRILLPGGDIRHVHYIAHQVVSTTGRTKEYVGTLLDLTSQKEVEEALDPALRTLTPRERQIVPLVAEAHRTHIMKKLGLHSASELVRYAISNGLVEL
jgi:DNA-binding NarL/FixJ family response regulator